jgi:hypothetical protein
MSEQWTVEVAPEEGPWHTDLNGAVFYPNRDAAIGWATWLCRVWPAVRVRDEGTSCEVLQQLTPDVHPG